MAQASIAAGVTRCQHTTEYVRKCIVCKHPGLVMLNGLGDTSCSASGGGTWWRGCWPVHGRLPYGWFIGEFIFLLSTRQAVQYPQPCCLATGFALNNWPPTEIEQSYRWCYWVHTRQCQISRPPFLYSFTIIICGPAGIVRKGMVMCWRNKRGLIFKN